MTISSTTLPLVRTMGRSARILLATAAILVLVTVAFVVGRATVSSSSTPAQAPMGVQAPTSNNTGICYPVAHFPLAAC
jgi:hypothetical protein